MLFFCEGEFNQEKAQQREKTHYERTHPKIIGLEPWRPVAQLNSQKIWMGYLNHNNINPAEKAEDCKCYQYC